VRLLKCGKHLGKLHGQPRDHQVELACMANRRPLVDRLRARVTWAPDGSASRWILIEIDNLIGTALTS
jgi:hypothetical protein